VSPTPRRELKLLGRPLQPIAADFYPQKRTLVERVEMSALCQKRTSVPVTVDDIFDSP
jgi:hypothetical protein